MALRDEAIAAQAKAHGGNGVLLSSDDREYEGMLSTGSAYTTGQASVYSPQGLATAYGSATTTSAAFSHPIFRRNSKFYVIRYL